MTVEKVDLRGLVCPEPVIRAKKILDGSATAAVEALVDDDVCVNNLHRLAKSLKAGFGVRELQGHYCVTIDKSGESVVADAANTQPEWLGKSTAQDKQTFSVVFLAKDTFGQGDEEFSKTLLNVFLQSLLESGQLPRAILMANTGVKLMDKDGQTRKVLDDFKAAGCEVLVCGLCVEYYNMKDHVPKEQITNMFAIVQYLTAANSVIQP